MSTDKVKNRVLDFAADICKSNALKVLVQVCEDSGHSKNHYTEGSRSSFYGLDTLERYELIYTDRSNGSVAVYPTEYGKSLYTGLWYAVGKDALVPRMQSKHILVPFIFWPTTEYVIKRTGDTVLFLDEDNSIPAKDLFISSDGDIWFSVEGMDGRFMFDIDEDIDVTDKETQECIKEIVAKSREIDRQKAERSYDEMIDFSEDK